MVYGYFENWFCVDDFCGCVFINVFGEFGGMNFEVVVIVWVYKVLF